MRQISIFLLLFTILLLTGCNSSFEINSSVRETFHVKRGRYYLPVMVRGNTASRKILLFIQGGPGINTLDFARVDYPRWRESLEKDFAIAYYDQLGTGNRTGKFDIDNVSFESWLEDIHDIVFILKEKYKADVFLFGHSFGGVLAHAYSAKYEAEGKATGIVAFNAPFTTDNDAIRWQFRHSFLINLANEFIAKKESLIFWTEVLNYLQDNPVLNSKEKQKAWNKYVSEGTQYGIPVNEDDLPVPSVGDYVKVVFTSSYSALTSNMNQAVLSKIKDKLIAGEAIFDLGGKLNKLNTPTLIVTGKYDDIFPPEEAVYFYSNISANNKELVIIDNAAHDPYLQNPVDFNRAVRNFLSRF